ncbi:ThiF family protein [Pilobolus umbonatus]|nr:ThiF family protein [Pilobolus umbonatus]
MSVQIDLRTQKYDRQLSRLWAATGQDALEHAHICLLNAAPTGCEILKNLILPGVGSVTIVDDSLITQEDIQSNFFLHPDSIGQSKSTSVRELLQELNEDASVYCDERNPVDIINQDPHFFNSFSLIISVNMANKDALKVAKICNEYNKTFIHVKSIGFIGVFSIQSPEHTVIEAHTENMVDLRLSSPFHQLADYVSGLDFDQLDQTDHAHIPFVVVILKMVDKWKKLHQGNAPKSYAERKEFTEMIRSQMRTPDEENFHEAIANVWRLGSSDKASSDVLQILNDPASINAHSDSPVFWILARAVKDFVDNEGNGTLPLSGKLPDMKSNTVNYVNLQNIYRDKALYDLEIIKRNVHNIIKGTGITIDLKDIETFAKNAATIKVIRYRNLNDNFTSIELSNALKNDENIYYYFAIFTADSFFDRHGRYPSNDEDNDEFRITMIKAIREKGASSEDIDKSIQYQLLDKAIINFIRFRNIEIPNIASLVGGLVAQESIKLITHQYIPINNTCIFNGITSTSNVFEL